MDVRKNVSKKTCLRPAVPAAIHTLYSIKNLFSLLRRSLGKGMNLTPSACCSLYHKSTYRGLMRIYINMLFTVIKDYKYIRIYNFCSHEVLRNRRACLKKMLTQFLIAGYRSIGDSRSLIG